MFVALVSYFVAAVEFVVVGIDDFSGRFVDEEKVASFDLILDGNVLVSFELCSNFRGASKIDLISVDRCTIVYAVTVFDVGCVVVGRVQGFPHGDTRCNH